MVKQNTRSSIIEIQNVVKRFPVGDAEVAILKGISLTVSQGEFVSVIGPSGSGKSTLINMMTGIDRPSSGTVVVAGCPIHTMSEMTWRPGGASALASSFNSFRCFLRSICWITSSCRWSWRGNTRLGNAKSERNICWKWWGWPTKSSCCPAWYRAGSSSAQPLPRAGE